MRVIRYIWKWCSVLWQSSGSLPSSIDSHKWESKIEIYKTLKENISSSCPAQRFITDLTL
jgi:hypothetical protein